MELWGPNGRKDMGNWGYNPYQWSYSHTDNWFHFVVRGDIFKVNEK